MNTATGKQKLPSEAPLDNTSDQSTSSLDTGQLGNNSNQQAIETEQTPDAGVCPGQGEQPKNSIPKLANIEVVSISEIKFDESQVDHRLVSQLKASVSAEWGQLLTPPVVSRLPEPENGKKWQLERGDSRLFMAKELGWGKITVCIVEATGKEKRLLVLESKMIRSTMTTFQQMENFYEWRSLMQATHKEYQQGGDQATKAASRKEQLLPTLEEAIEIHTGLKKTAFHGKINTYEKLTDEMKSYFKEHPDLPILRKETQLARFAKYKPEEQKMCLPGLKLGLLPEDAYFKAIRTEKADKAASLPVDELFPVHHEDFRQNAERIPDEAVDLILTDPNWLLAENNKQGKMYKKGSLEIAPYLTHHDWETFVELAAKKLHPNGHLAVLFGPGCFFEMSDIVRKHFNPRWIMPYVHGSGSGTTAPEAYVASHWRPILLCRRKDAPPFTSEYTEYVHDVVPSTELVGHRKHKPEMLVTLPLDEPLALLRLLKTERALLDQRIAFLEASGEDLLSNDTVMSPIARAHALKMFHPWAQDVSAFRQVIRGLTKPGDFVWDPFIGSGTTGIAAVTCQERLFVNGELKEVLAPRRGMGCDIMPLWANIARRRIWEAQHGKPDSFDKLDEMERKQAEKEQSKNEEPGEGDEADDK